MRANASAQGAGRTLLPGIRFKTFMGPVPEDVYGPLAATTIRLAAGEYVNAEYLDPDRFPLCLNYLTDEHALYPLNQSSLTRWSLPRELTRPRELKSHTPLPLVQSGPGMVYGGHG